MHEFKPGDRVSYTDIERTYHGVVTHIHGDVIGVCRVNWDEPQAGGVKTTDVATRVLIKIEG